MSYRRGRDKRLPSEMRATDSTLSFIFAIVLTQTKLPTELPLTKIPTRAYVFHLPFSMVEVYRLGKTIVI